MFTQCTDNESGTARNGSTGAEQSRSFFEGSRKRKMWKSEVHSGGGDKAINVIITLQAF